MVQGGKLSSVDKVIVDGIIVTDKNKFQTSSMITLNLSAVKLQIISQLQICHQL